MSGRAKGDFLESTKRKLAGRAGYRCSFPGCRLFLVGPHSDGESVVNVGVAAHIKGAAPGSARYDKDQSEKARKHISNGVWMCWTHSVQIDNDEKLYPSDILKEWKNTREEHARLEYANNTDESYLPGSLARPEVRHRLDSDLRYRQNDLVVSYDAWKDKVGGFTGIKLSVEGEISSMNEMVPLAVSSVQAYLVSVGLRGQYLHIFAQVRDLKFATISRSYPEMWASQFEEFENNFLAMDFTKVPGIEGAVFDLIGGDVKGTGEWDWFMIDITCLYPEIYSDHIDKNDMDESD